MSNTAALLSVKCLVPANGTGAGASIVAGVLGSLVNIGALVGTTAGAGFLAISFAAISGYGAGAGLLKSLDTWMAGSDELYINLDGKKLWPIKEKYSSIDSQETQTVGQLFDLGKPRTVELFEYDKVSGDDSMGSLTIDSDHSSGMHRYLIISDKKAVFTNSN